MQSLVAMKRYFWPSTGRHEYLGSYTGKGLKIRHPLGGVVTASHGTATVIMVTGVEAFEVTMPKPDLFP